MDDLIAFYRARLDEDEQAARWAVRESSFRERGLGEEWEVVRTGPEMRELVIQTRPKAFRPHRVVGGLDPLLDETVAAHIARHDPARVLREVEAKRRILDEHYVAQGTVGGQALMVCTRCSDYIDRGEIFKAEAAPCKTLKLLALPYADVDGYREEWKP